MFKPPAIVTNALNSKLERFGSHYGSLFGAPTSKGTKSIPPTRRDELKEYKNVEHSNERVVDEKERVRIMREMTDAEEIAPLEKRWENSWSHDSLAAYVMLNSIRVIANFSLEISNHYEQ